MHRTMTNAAPEAGLALPLRTDETGAAAATVTTGRRLPRWLLVVLFWTLIALIYSTRAEVRVGPSTWVSISWVDALKAAASQWYAWGLLSVGIYWVNRILPVGRDALILRFLIHIPLSLAFTVAYTYLNHGLAIVLDAPVDSNWVGATVMETASRVTYRLGMFVYWAIVAICVALDYQGELKDRQIRTTQLERSLSDARLAALRSQLDPHFLFNTLNSISAYVESKPREARRMLEQLGELLRMSLDHADSQEIPLERELAFVSGYVQLQRVRFDIDVGVDVDPEALGAAVPTFVLQPLIENAIRHGVSRRVGPRRIEIAARREQDRLRLEVRDNGAGLPAGWDLKGRRGIGLSNTQARLRHLYEASEHELSVGPGPQGVGTQVTIVLPFHMT